MYSKLLRNPYGSSHKCLTFWTSFLVKLFKNWLSINVNIYFWLILIYWCAALLHVREKNIYSWQHEIYNCGYFEKYFHNHIKSFDSRIYILLDSCQRYLLNTIPCSDSPVIVIECISSECKLYLRFARWNSFCSIWLPPRIGKLASAIESNTKLFGVTPPI